MYIKRQVSLNSQNKFCFKKRASMFVLFCELFNKKKVHRKKGKSNFSKALNKNLFQEADKLKVKNECENKVESRVKFAPSKRDSIISEDIEVKIEEEEVIRIEKDINSCLDSIQEDSKVDTGENVAFEPTLTACKISTNFDRLEKSQSDSSFCSDLFSNDHVCKKEVASNKRVGTKSKSSIKRSIKCPRRHEKKPILDFSMPSDLSHFTSNLKQSTRRHVIQKIYLTVSYVSNLRCFGAHGISRQNHHRRRPAQLYKLTRLLNCEFSMQQLWGSYVAE